MTQGKVWSRFSVWSFVSSLKWKISTIFDMWWDNDLKYDFDWSWYSQQNYKICNMWWPIHNRSQKLCFFCCKYCKSLPFFYFLTFKKGRLLYIHFSDIFPVGWSVGPLLDEANFVQIWNLRSCEGSAVYFIQSWTAGTSLVYNFLKLWRAFLNWNKEGLYLRS